MDSVSPAGLPSRTTWRRPREPAALRRITGVAYREIAGAAPITRLGLASSLSDCAHFG
jgi:hypothetical protein